MLNGAEVNQDWEVLNQELEEDFTPEVENLYRIRFGDQIKYITVEGGIWDIRAVLCFPPTLLAHLPRFPQGDWTEARVFKDPSGAISYQLLFTPLPGVKHCWHPNIIDIRMLKKEEHLDHRVNLVRHNSKLAVSKIAPFDWTIPAVESETAAYEMIEGHNIGPAFLGHLIEHYRVIGFLIGYLEGRRAGIEDLEGCGKVIKRLHALGIVHGDLNRHNFVVTPSGVKLIDFEYAERTDDTKVMEDELKGLRDVLLDESGLGGIMVMEASE